MDNLQDNAFHVPALFMFLCCFAAASFLLATYFWLWRAGRVKADEDLPSLWSYITAFQYYGFLSVMVLSCILGAYDYLSADKPLVVYAEVFVLAAAMVVALCRGGTGLLFKLMRRVFLSFLASCSFWIVSIGIGWVIGNGLYALYSSFATIEDFSIIAVLCVGVAWIVPIFVMYRCLSTEQRRGVKFYNVLMPVLLAYIMLLIPLFVQQTANSPQWQKMMHSSRPVRKI